LLTGGLLVGGGFLCAVQLSLLYGRELAPHHTRDKQRNASQPQRRLQPVG
jgi:hypothetical protein